MIGPQKTLLAIGALLGFLAVAFGAFGSHLLRGRLSQHMFDVYEIGVRYHLAHAVAIFAMALAISTLTGSTIIAAAWLLVVGVIIFSGSLYLLALTGVMKWGMITPIGGVLLLLGWLTALIAALL
jgi:uncharacterized membrane protein YgdD (TMEM256/DUF423 family)